MFPIAIWMTGAMMDPINRVFEESRLIRDGYIMRDTVAGLVKEHVDRRIDHHVRIWQLLNLELWYRMYIENEPHDELASELTSAKGGGALAAAR